MSLTTVEGCKDIRIGCFMSNIKNYSFACVAILYLYGELMSISLSGFSYSLERKQRQSNELLVMILLMEVFAREAELELDVHSAKLAWKLLPQRPPKSEGRTLRQPPKG